ncbi:hypothetical protein [Actinomadura macra]|uniref:hypothetical protein n=1 Tax=Actinomadura macra TaxID=46164 RepID=UPI000A6D632F|nr:hypothetical protein [Actinomadura macra]
MTEDIAHRMAQNPAFQQVVAAAMELFSGQAAVVKDLDDERRRGYVDKANALRADARRNSEANREAQFGDLGALAGITQAEARALTLRVRDAAQQFVTAFPELRSMNERTQIDTLTDAVKRDPVLISAVERLLSAGSAGAGEESPQTCQAICLALLITFMAAATAMFIVGLAGCVWLGWIPPLMVLCMLGAIAAYLAFMALVWNIYNGCAAGCEQGDDAR